MQKQTKLIKSKYREEIQNTNKMNLFLIVGSGVLVVLYFMYSDLIIQNNVYAFYTRLLPVVVGVSLLLFHLFTKKKYGYLKTIALNIFLLSLLIMMYAKYLVYTYMGSSANSVMGIILVIFTISFFLNTNIINTILIYLLPTLIFIIILYKYFDLTENVTVNLSNIYAMIIGGLVANRVQLKLRFNLYKSNFLLDQEMEKSKQLYEETLTMNEELLEKNEETTYINKELTESNATKNKLISIIAHDLKSPFNGMLGFSNLLVDNYDSYDIESQKKYIHIIHQSINSTYKLLNNLLTWTATQNETINLMLANENLYQLAEESIEPFKQILKEKTINLLNQINKDVTVKADKDLLETVFRNLISNAIKFTPKGGSISLIAEKAKNSSPNSIQITVKDSGVGMPLDVQLRLFKISENISTKGTENESGTGLGLILCKEFIEKHGGQIWVKSEQEKGSEFIFTLPM